jgi:hypothetical protein
MNVRGAVELLGIIHRSVKGLVSAAATDRDLFGLELCDRCYVRGNGDVTISLRMVACQWHWQLTTPVSSNAPESVLLLMHLCFSLVPSSFLENGME